jgi:hypothetical protein
MDLSDLAASARALRTAAEHCRAEAAALRRSADTLVWQGHTGEAFRRTVLGHADALGVAAAELEAAARAVDLHLSASALAQEAALAAEAARGLAKLAHAVLP